MGYIITAIIVLFFTAIFGGAFLVDKAACNQVAEMSGKQTQYRLIGGCYVEVNGRFIPKDNWRGEYDQ